MLDNRISPFFRQVVEQVPAEGETRRHDARVPSSGKFPPVVNVADLYQAAHAKAVFDHELNKLFNPDCYES